MRILIASLALLTAAPAVAQDDLTALSDEFNGTELSGWTRFDQAYGWPDKLKAIDLGKTTPGALHLEPYDVAWVRDLNAPFLFKEVQGDFDVRARVRVKSANGDIPGGTWSLGGLMARVPNGSTAANWRPRAENWHFITTGVGQAAGQQMTETKSTFNSYSSLKLRPFPTGWVELRLVRMGMVMIALARPDGETKWQVRDRFYRMEFRPQMQVGLIAYTTSDDSAKGPENPEGINRSVNTTARVDMQLDVDWIRFSRPKLKTSPDWVQQVTGAGNPMADPNLSEEAILAAIGN
ncbi:hypothetical protein [Caulobacter sp. NIBR2454]|uniref:hypothetical protein n=1 Tax=Caulobacter sp. NIBR2454 TaxID=3015996 RepID=UPI0022B614BD|nr:hypothetical protein [Caulobacter sp. NIBR2454]